MRKDSYSSKYVGMRYGFRSGLERSVNTWLNERKIDGQYEKNVIKYTIPARDSKYTPDFTLPNGIIVETKGRFVATDRKKHLLIREQHPELDIRFVFSSSKSKIRKGSKTTYAVWCEKYEFKYADKEIPEAWLTE